MVITVRSGIKMSKKQLSLCQAFEKKRTKPKIPNTQQSGENEGATSRQAGHEDDVASSAQRCIYL